MIAVGRKMVDIPPMAGIIKLEDGSDIYASSIGLAGAIERIAGSVSDIDGPLARWLLDVARRPAPFMDFDLRGLNATRRTAFWTGVDRAYNSFLEWDQAASFSPAVEVIRLLYERRCLEPTTEDRQVPQIDLDELWFDGNAS